MEAPVLWNRWSPTGLLWQLRRRARGRAGRTFAALALVAVAGGAVSMFFHRGSAPGHVALIRVSGNHLVDGSGNTVQLRGVDLSGTEFSCIQGGTASSRGWSIYGG
ncbi:MAG TPA: hypothetical protein VKL22_02375, partial [Actinomycetota bacterium]|nr:hypothetical protein [Actinomycetota bacterium]